MAVLVLALGPDNVFADIALFFSKMAVVTFGGAYAVLAYVAQEAVGHYGWLGPGEMLDGPRHGRDHARPPHHGAPVRGLHGRLPRSRRACCRHRRRVARHLGHLRAVLCRIFLGAPWMERLRGNRALSSALSAVTAAVVGVVLNLAIWFALHVVWREVARWRAGPIRLDLPVVGSIDWAAAALVALALVAVFSLRLGIVTVLAGAAATGIAINLLGLTP
ncbi:MAG: chromate transporter [Paracoccaceae bacterium]